MNRILTALGTASLLALTACGGSAEPEANNVTVTDEVALPADENSTLGADTLGDQANALDSTNSVDANATATDANLSGNATEANNAAENVTNGL